MATNAQHDPQLLSTRRRQVKHRGPILFLDVDGVLNKHATLKGEEGVRDCVLQRQYSLTQHVGVVETAKVRALARMLIACNAKIVVSSSWREGVADRAAFAAAIGLVPPLASAPDLIHRDWRTEGRFSSQRYHEIGFWLDDHRGVKNYAILDDHDFMPLDWPLRDRFVKTDPTVGLTNDALNRVATLFGRSDLAFVCETHSTDWFADEPCFAKADGEN